MVKKDKSLTSKILLYAVMVVLCIVFLFPYFFMLLRSLMPEQETLFKPVRFFPQVWTLGAYGKLFSSAQFPYGVYLSNSLIIAIFNAIFIPLTAAMAAYGFAKLHFFYKKPLFAVMLATMMVPGVVLQVPMYVLYAALGLLGSKAPLMVTALFGGGAINVFLIRQFMKGIPSELENAARIDGAGALRRFVFVTIPLCWPVILYVMVTTFIACWGDFYGALVYLQNDADKTLAIGIFDQAMTGRVGNNVIMAAGVFMSVVPVTLFAIFQKQLIQGIAIGGIKG